MTKYDVPPPSPRLREAYERLRATDPRPDDLARVRERLRIRLGGGGGGVGVGRITRKTDRIKAGVGGVGAVALLAIGAAIAWPSRGPQPPQAEPTSPAVPAAQMPTATRDSTMRPVRANTEPPPPHGAGTGAPPTRSAATTGARPVATPGPDRGASTSSDRQQQEGDRPRSRRRQSRTEPADGNGASSIDEAALIARARDALDRNPQLTLHWIQRHRREFPGGLLRMEADVLEAEALARSGRRDEARRRAEMLLAGPAGDAYSHRLRRVLEPVATPHGAAPRR